MKVYVINLDRHLERLAHMREQLSDVGFERVAAIDGAKNPETSKGLTRFELACLESHRSAWRLFLKRSDEHACFLEDDVHLRPEFGALVDNVGWIPPDAHSVKLDTYLQEVKLGERRPVSGGREVARLYTRHESSAAYILSRAGAERYLELTARPLLPADYSLFPRSPRRVGLRVYQLTPAIAVQDHLLRPAHAFPTAMALGRSGKRRSSLFSRLWRETARLAGQAAGISEAIFLRASVRPETTTVDFE
jgi:GR25 family glycosyltransferase involved in LPS biosynthesis